MRIGRFSERFACETEERGKPLNTPCYMCAIWRRPGGSAARRGGYRRGGYRRGGAGTCRARRPLGKLKQKTSRETSDKEKSIQAPNTGELSTLPSIVRFRTSEERLRIFIYILRCVHRSKDAAGATPTKKRGNGLGNQLTFLSNKDLISAPHGVITWRLKRA